MTYMATHVSKLFKLILPSHQKRTRYPRARWQPLSCPPTHLNNSAIFSRPPTYDLFAAKGIRDLHIERKYTLVAAIGIHHP